LYEPDIEDVSNGEDEFSGVALILDDSATARKIVNEALTKMGFQVVEANDGQDGLEVLEDLYKKYGENIAENLKLILSDVEMPRMDGFHFAANVKKDGRFNDVPIIFNSSISDHFSEIRGKEAGAEAYLVKFQAGPFYEEVSRVVRAHMK